MAGLPGFRKDTKGGEEEAKGLVFFGSVCRRHARSPVAARCFRTSAMDCVQNADLAHNMP